MLFLNRIRSYTLILRLEYFVEMLSAEILSVDIFDTEIYGS